MVVESFFFSPPLDSVLCRTHRLSRTMESVDERLIPIESPVADEGMPLMASEGNDDTINLFACCKFPRAMFNIVALGLIFMLLFTAFAPSQVR